MGKSATEFSVFAARWQDNVLIHKKASTAAAVKGHITNSLIPAFGKLAMDQTGTGMVDVHSNSDRVSPFDGTTYKDW